MARLFEKLIDEATLFNTWTRIKAKDSAGGIDGISIAEFDKDAVGLIAHLSAKLAEGKWSPLPYLSVYVKKEKSPDEMRDIGLTTIADKIVQKTIVYLITPLLESVFVGNSYGYRPGKGALKAIRRSIWECQNNRNAVALRIDIDNFFDSIEHEIIYEKLSALIDDVEIVRLIMLCFQIGKVDGNKMSWSDSTLGATQGAPLSPIVSNLYLNDFDKYAISLCSSYVRYADDILFLCDSRWHAESILKKVEAYLNDKLHLSLNNTTTISSVNDGFDFLGIKIVGSKAILSEEKRNNLYNALSQLDFDSGGFSKKSNLTLNGIAQYYGCLLPQPDLEFLDSILYSRIKHLIQSNPNSFENRTILVNRMAQVRFMSIRYKKSRKQNINELASIYATAKNNARKNEIFEENRKLVRLRKEEYRRKEEESSGLLVNKPGSFIGLTKRGVTVSYKGKAVSHHPTGNLSQIVVTSSGVSLSSNLVGYCMSKGIPVDFFDNHGVHIGSFVSSRFIQNSLWKVQAEALTPKKNALAYKIIEGKVRNQLNLLKYFHKYHSQNLPYLTESLDRMEKSVDDYKFFGKMANYHSGDFVKTLMAREAQVAMSYWDYIRQLLIDDEVGFEHRIHRGADDLMNSMLNYGYAILYARSWQAILAARLNPFAGLIHVADENKPSLSFDFVEIFRSQAVDRVVIALIQKGSDLTMDNDKLSDSTRQLLSKSVMERLARYENYRGEEMKFEDIIRRQAKELASAIVGNKTFRPYLAKW